VDFDPRVQVIAPQGLRHVEILTKTITHQQERLPELARSILQTIVDQLNGTLVRIGEIEGRLARWHRQEPGQPFASDRAGCWRHGRQRDRRDGC
jgi:hypothetical protein